MDFGSMFQTWVKVLTSPGEEVFVTEKAKPSATLQTGLLWIFLAAVVAAILGFIQVQLFASSLGGMEAMLRQMDLPPEAQAQFDAMLSSGALSGMMGGASLSSIITIPIFFVIGVGILHLVASLLGGQGRFGRYAYLNATYSAPITILSAILSFIPIAGGCVAFLLSIYQLALTYFATKVEYSLSNGRAIIVVLVPLIAVFLLAACVGIFITAVAIGGGG